MKIAILTYWTSLNNYGQQLQLYALQTYLRQLGHDAYLVRYEPVKPNVSLFYKIINNLRPSALVPRVKRWFGANKALKENSLLEMMNRKMDTKREFESFRVSNLKMTDCVYHSLNEIQNNPPEADLYIVGSDQVWHDSLQDVNTEVWYLNFGKDQTKRVSYAASFGRTIADPEFKRFKELLSKFDAVSVREQSGLEQVKKAGRLDASIVVDPTLLLESDIYLNLCSNIPISLDKYLFVYILNVQSSAEIYCSHICDYLEKNNISLKTVSSSGYYPARELFENNRNILATIPEWLSLIRDSVGVVTTSFHGIVFSIILHKPFLAVLLQGKYSSANVRLHSLLGSLGLTDRIFDSNMSVDEQMAKDINWNEVEARLLSLRSSSKIFINSFLS